jgi:hypothetical protein
LALIAVEWRVQAEKEQEIQVKVTNIPKESGFFNQIKTTKLGQSSALSRFKRQKFA